MKMCSISDSRPIKIVLSRGSSTGRDEDDLTGGGDVDVGGLHMMY